VAPAGSSGEGAAGILQHYEFLKMTDTFITPFAAWLVFLRRGESEQFLMCTMLYKARDGTYPLQVVRPGVEDDCDILSFASDDQAFEQTLRAVLKTLAQFRPPEGNDQLRVAQGRCTESQSEDDFIREIEEASGGAFTIHRTQ